MRTRSPRLPSLQHVALTAAILIAWAGDARADVIPVPTLVADYLWFGLPAGPIVGLMLLAAVVLLYRRRRKAGKGRGRAAAMGILLFVAGNLLCYVLALQQRQHGKGPPVPPQTIGVDGATYPVAPKPASP
jgi:LPXTG-motif cell wall-anchored protein